MYSSTSHVHSVNDTFQAAGFTRFAAAAKMIGLDEQRMAALNSPVKITTVRFPVLLDSGRRQEFEGYRVTHSTTLGPARGGIRFGAGINLQAIQTLAETMTWKSALIGLPFGGAMSGIVCDPQQLSATELEKLTRAYTQAIQEQLNTTEPPPSNSSTLPGEMEWLLDEFSTLHGKTIHSIVTGKQSPYLDTLGRTEATGRGVSIVTLLALQKLHLKPYEATAAIQGFGNVGLHTAAFLYNKGVKIVAVSDITAAYFNPEGFIVPDLIRHMQSHNNTLEGYDKGIAILHEELLTLPVDVLIPAAKEEVITEVNAAGIKAAIIVEAANNPVAPAADHLLQQQGRFVVPDILANAGGIILSYFEWLQQKLQESWDVKQVNNRLREILENCFSQVYETAAVQNTSLRMGAYLIGLQRITAAQFLAEKIPSSPSPFN